MLERIVAVLIAAEQYLLKEKPMPEESFATKLEPLALQVVGWECTRSCDTERGRDGQITKMTPGELKYWLEMEDPEGERFKAQVSKLAFLICAKKMVPELDVEALRDG
jgi:hypothetical protein